MDVWEITTINQTPPYKNKSVDFYDISNFLCVSAISDIQPQRARCSCIAQKNTHVHTHCWIKDALKICFLGPWKCQTNPGYSRTLLSVIWGWKLWLLAPDNCNPHIWGVGRKGSGKPHLLGHRTHPIHSRASLSTPMFYTTKLLFGSDATHLDNKSSSEQQLLSSHLLSD